MTDINEIQVSALLDGELDREATLAAVDRLLESDDLRTFYRSARQLDTALSDARQRTAAGELPPQLWNRIVESAAVAPTAPSSRRSAVLRKPVVRWGLQAAAMVLVAVATWLLAPPAERAVHPTGRNGDVTTVSLSGDAGQMTQGRFVEITTELLQADPRYRHQMNQILDAVGAPALEGSSEGPLPLTDGGPAFRRVRAEDLDGGTRTWD